jgi:hypothetical protein
MMKATTKAKRRATLSICSVGVMDETELETIPEAQPMNVTPKPETLPETKAPINLPTNNPIIKFPLSDAGRSQLIDLMNEMQWSEARQKLVLQKAELISGEKVALDAITKEYEKFLESKKNEPAF